MREIKRFQNLEIILVSWSGIHGQNLAPDSTDWVRGYLKLVIKSTLVLVTLVLFSFKTNYKDNEK